MCTLKFSTFSGVASQGLYLVPIRFLRTSFLSKFTRGSAMMRAVMSSTIAEIVSFPPIRL
jgi:hypothetical protein